MQNNLLLDGILEYFPDEQFLKADGFDSAVIGVETGEPMRLIYSVAKVLEILVTEHEMTVDDALEHFDFNIKGSYLGERTPIWCDDAFYL